MNAKGPVIQHADPQASVFVNYAGLVGIATSAGTVGLLLLLPVAFLIEFGAPLGFKIAAAEWSRGKPAYAEMIDITPMTRMQDLPPIKPETPLLTGPEPLTEEMSQKVKALQDFSHLVVKTKGKVGASGRKLAEHLGYKHATFAAYLAEWKGKGEILEFTENGRRYYKLPDDKLAIAQRELVMPASSADLRKVLQTA